MNRFNVDRAQHAEHATNESLPRGHPLALDLSRWQVVDLIIALDELRNALDRALHAQPADTLAAAAQGAASSQD